MQVFLTGANGWVGTAITRELIGAGHSVVGLVRTEDKAEAVAAAGATPLLGALRDLDVLREAAQQADGVIHTAFGLDLSNIAALSEEDRLAIEAFGAVYAGSERPIVVTSGLGLLPPGETFTEEARPPLIPGFPRASEQTAFALMLAALARKTGVSAYVGDGQNLWPAVHRLDAARLFRLALERGARDEAFHAVAEGVAFRRVAEAIGRQLGLPAASLTPEAAEAHFGPLAQWVAGNGPASSARTRAVLGWNPREPDLIADIDRPDYYA